jgi:predicted cupin superfamily sugar epimerase
MSLARIEELVSELNLVPHPEGGFYAETYRSKTDIPGTERQLLTSIYFLLTSSNCSRFHRIRSDEAWYFHEGSGLTVHELYKGTYKQTKLGPVGVPFHKPFYLVEAGSIFGSSIDTSDGYALVSCAVSPGFDFRDFELFNYDQLVSQFPQYEEIIRRLT